MDLEHEDLSTSWGHDTHLFYSRQAASPPGEAHSDYWICARLAERLGFGAQYTQGRSEEEWVRHFLHAGSLDVPALQADGLMRIDGQPRVELAEFRADPVAHPLRTASGRIEIASPQALAHGLPAIPSYVPDEADEAQQGYPLQLVTPHSRLRSNSCLHTNPWLRALEPHAVWINPRDAAARGLQHGQLAEVSSPSGTLILPAKVTERIMPGVVCIYQGTWYEPDAGDAAGVAGVDRGGCANTLTSQRLSPSGGYATHSAWVEIRRAGP
jgi:anaerobic dimethyl sulfoxide reductase subunit A